MDIEPVIVKTNVDNVTITFNKNGWEQGSGITFCKLCYVLREKFTAANLFMKIIDEASYDVYSDDSEKVEQLRNDDLEFIRYISSGSVIKQMKVSTIDTGDDVNRSINSNTINIKADNDNVSINFPKKDWDEAYGMLLTKTCISLKHKFLTSQVIMEGIDTYADYFYNSEDDYDYKSESEFNNKLVLKESNMDREIIISIPAPNDQPS